MIPCTEDIFLHIQFIHIIICASQYTHDLTIDHVGHFERGLNHLLFYTGLTAIQIRRFQRCWENSQSSESPNTKVSTNESGIKSIPWRENKFGYIPHPQTKRATFLNEKVEPNFSNSK